MKRLCRSRPKMQFQKGNLISLDFVVSLIGEMEVAAHDTVVLSILTRSVVSSNSLVFPADRNSPV
jgi:hypothetical protein